MFATELPGTLASGTVTGTGSGTETGGAAATAGTKATSLPATALALTIDSKAASVPLAAGAIAAVRGETFGGLSTSTGKK